MGRRGPNVTEQLSHIQLSLEVNARKASEEALVPNPEPPTGSGLTAVRGGWWPNGWLGEDNKGEPVPYKEDTSDGVVVALGIMVRLAYTNPTLGDVERAYYRARAVETKDSYDQVRRNAAAYIERANAEYEAQLKERCG
jgi:hypothetical protein